MEARCDALDQERGSADRIIDGKATVKLRIQRNVKTGEVFLLPSIDEGIRVRSHRGGPAIRFYVIRLMRAGLVKPKQVIRLRIVEGRLLLVGVRSPV